MTTACATSAATADARCTNKALAPFHDAIDCLDSAFNSKQATPEKYADGIKDMEKVLELEPGMRLARERKARLTKLEEERMEKLKVETMGKLKDLGNSILGNFGLSTDNFKFDKDETSGSYNSRFEQNPGK